MSDAIDEKLLPNGVFADIRNGRIPQGGSLRLRRGWRPVTMTALDGTGLFAIDLHSSGSSLVMVDSGLRSAVLVESNATRPWVLNTAAALSPVTQLRNVGNIPDLNANVERASAALTADGVYGCVLVQTATRSVVRVFERDSDQTLTVVELSNGSRVRKVVSLGSTFGLVENSGTQIDLYTLTPTATAPAFSLTATLLSATQDWFDVAVATDTTPGKIHLVTTDTAGTGATEYRQFTTAGVIVGAAKTVAATDTKASTVYTLDDTRVHVAFQKASDSRVSLLSFSGTSPYTTSAGPTELNAQTIIRGRFAIGETGSSIFVASERSSGASDLNRAYVNRLTLAHANTSFEQLSVQLYGGYLSNGGFAAAGFTLGGPLPSGNRGRVAAYQSIEQPWVYAEFGIGARDSSTSHAPFWPALAPTGDALILTPIDRTPEAPSDTTPRTAKVQSLKVASLERRPSAELAGALYITGGVLMQWTDGYSETSLAAPALASLSPSNGSGSLTLTGVYSYIAQLVWQDEQHRTHRSDLSVAANQTLVGAEDTMTVQVNVPKTLRRSGNLITNPRIELYRTEAGPGELFYLTNTGAVDTFTDSVTIVDIASDATLIGNPQLVTQGEFGATSGVLPMCPPRASSFIAATKRRLVLGSADTAWQWSQVSFPETQIWFAEPGLVGDPAQAYFDDVEAGRITGVAALDELAFIGTSSRLYVTGGAGPNLAGIGEFDPPHRLPADVGFYNAQSILETSEGLWFLGGPDTMYQVPRGSGTPVLDHSAQDRFSTSITVVGAGYESADNLAAWAASNATLIARKLDTQQWFGDGLPFTPIALLGHRGRLYAVASDGVVWAQESAAYGDGASGATAVALRVTTGQVAPFEMAGQGRLACVEVLGEFQAAAAILGEISYDDGQSWTSLGTHTVSGLTTGDTFQREWFPARQRGDRFRFRITMTPTVTTTEGCRLTGLVVQYTKRNGPSRLASASRK